eukprot:TRINITY_DN2747_c0_g2_i2.p1 TRINITY_DN2747_c0_g2~~TRINITY_DN2747_c0_g2_i2.p1  ORF type:complete len:836 (+),score=197.90 TRINITY_DN2747_c0_g2_i2:303-2810(+)
MSSLAQSTSSGTLSVDARLLLDPPPISVLDTIIEEPETEPPVDVLSRSLPESSPLADLIQHFEEPFMTTPSSPPKAPTDQDERSGNDNKPIHLIDEEEHTHVVPTTLLTTAQEDDDDSSYFSESSASVSSDEVSEADYESSDDSYDVSDQSDEADFFDSDTPRKSTPRYSSIDDLYEIYKASLAEESGSIINPASAITLSSSPAVSPLALQVSQSLSPKNEIAKTDEPSQSESSVKTDSVELAEKTERLEEESEKPKLVEQEQSEEPEVNQVELSTSTEPTESSKPQTESTEQIEPPKQLEQSGQSEPATPSEQPSERGEETKLDTELKVEISQAETNQTEQSEKVNEPTTAARPSTSIEFKGGRGKGSRIFAPLTNQVIVLQEVKLEQIAEEPEAVNAEDKTDENKQKEDGKENNDWRAPTLEEGAQSQTNADVKEENCNDVNVEPVSADIQEESKQEAETQVINVTNEQSSVSEVKADSAVNETVEEKVTDVVELAKEARSDVSIKEPETETETVKEVHEEGDVKADKEETRSVQEVNKPPAAEVKESKDSRRAGGASDLLDPKEISRKKAKERAAQKFQERSKYKSKHKNEEDSPEQKEKTVTVAEDKKLHKESKDRKKDKAKRQVHQMHRSKSTDLRRYADDHISMLQPSVSITSFSSQESDMITPTTPLAAPTLIPITTSSSVPNSLVTNTPNTPSPVASPSPSPTVSPAGSLRKKKLSEKFEAWLSKGSDSKPSAAATLSAADAKRLKHSNSFSVRKTSGTYDKDEAEFATYFATLKRKTSSRAGSTAPQTSSGLSPLSGSPTSSSTPTTSTSSSPTSWLDRFLRKEKA